MNAQHQQKASKLAETLAHILAKANVISYKMDLQNQHVDIVIEDGGFDEELIDNLTAEFYEINADL